MASLLTICVGVRPFYTAYSAIFNMNQDKDLFPGLGRSYDIVLCAENVEGASENTTEKLVTPIGVPDAEPVDVHYELVDGKVCSSWR